MDITPAIPKGKKIIKGYGEMAFKINDETHQNSIILVEDSVQVWGAKTHADINIESLKNHIKDDDNVEILLIGCGDKHKPLDTKIHMHFSQINIGVEIMTTGAACRTYNVLLAEGRNVAAALIAV